MNQIDWNYKISKGSGQKKDKDSVLIDKTTEYKLSISAKGTQEQLESLMQKIAPLIAKIGGQETLDIDFE